MRTPQVITILMLGGVGHAMAQPAPSAPPPPPGATGDTTATMPRSPDEPASVSAAAPAPAAAWKLAVAPRLGLIVPTAKLGAMAIGGLQVDVALPVADHKLLVGIDASFTRPGHDGTVMDPRLPATATYTIKEQEVVVALLASYRFADQSARLVPWAGAGPMLHLLHSAETTSAAPGENTATSTELGVEVGGGLDYRTGPGYLGGELRFAYSKLDHTITGDTNAGKFALAVAYRLVF